MDRRFLPITLALALAGCRDRRGEATAIEDAGAAAAVAARPGAAPPLEPPELDAGPGEEDTPAAPIKPGDLLSGAAAEQVIADSVAPAPREAPPPDAPEFRISPTGVGPFVIGMSRREVTTALGRRGFVRKVWTPPGEVGVDLGELRLPTGMPLLKLRIYGGRLTEITVVARDARARTDAEIMVGSTFDEATLAHGDARKVTRGFVLEDLPGVIMVPAASAAADPVPPPATRIVAMIVVGPEND